MRCAQLPRRAGSRALRTHACWEVPGAGFGGARRPGEGAGLQAAADALQSPHCRELSQPVPTEQVVSCKDVG